MQNFSQYQSQISSTPFAHFFFHSFKEHLQNQPTGFRFPRAVNRAKKVLQRSLSNASQGAALVPDVPKGYLAVYVGDETNMKRFVIPVSYLNQSVFQELLSQAEEEYGFDHPMGGLTIPCSEDSFIDLVARLNAL